MAPDDKALHDLSRSLNGETIHPKLPLRPPACCRFQDSGPHGLKNGAPVIVHHSAERAEGHRTNGHRTALSHAIDRD